MTCHLSRLLCLAGDYYLFYLYQLAEVVVLTDGRGHHSSDTSDSVVGHELCATFSTGVSADKAVSNSSATYVQA